MQNQRKLCTNGAQSKLNRECGDGRNQHEQKRVEPQAQIERGQDRKAQFRTGIVPGAVIVFRNHAETVTASGQARVVRRPPRSHIDPVPVEALELIAAVNLDGMV